MVRRATESDLPRALAIYDSARRFMRSNGNTVQWVNGYPSEALLRQDVERGDLYVMEDGGTHAAAAAAHRVVQRRHAPRRAGGGGGLGADPAAPPAGGYP